MHSSGTRTSTHYNLVLGGETALMMKEEFIERYGVPLYTVGVGGSGGGIQQYVYGQNHPGLIDAGIPQYSYPDMVTQTIHVGDCELLENFMDNTDGTNPKWQNWNNREWLEGLNADSNAAQPLPARSARQQRVREGLARTHAAGAEPAVVPVGSAGSSGWTRPRWRRWSGTTPGPRNIYGVEPDGHARNTYDNVGVQYGLKALTDGNITPAEFLKLNATVGSWKEARDMVQEAFPFPSPPPPMPPARAGFDPWSAGNMRLSSDGGATPAPRRAGDLIAMHNATRRGLYFDGKIDIPLIDWRHYLEEELDMHNSHQSFASRQRMRDRDGDASNQVIWFTDARPARAFDQTPEAFEVMDEWMANTARTRERGVAGNKPALATDRCFTTAGDEIARGANVWDGILDSGPPARARRRSRCTRPRARGGRPARGGVYNARCSRSTRAIARGCTAPGASAAEVAD